MRRIDELHLNYPFASSRMLRDMLGSVSLAAVEVTIPGVVTTSQRPGAPQEARRWEAFSGSGHPIDAGGSTAVERLFLGSRGIPGNDLECVP